MEETPTKPTPVDAILDALDEAIQTSNLERAAAQLEQLRRELAVRRGVQKLDRTQPPIVRDYPPGD